MIKESYISNIKNLPKDAVIMEVTRTKGHPLSPSQELLNEYKKGKIGWVDFVERFKKEMDNDMCKSMMKNIKELSKTRNVYLVCYEKDYQCHRFILMDMIRGLI